MPVTCTPRSAYIHIPFCGHRCGYCNFTLLAGRDDLMGVFLESLELELQRTLRIPQEVDTIFLGGGTPTHLPTDLLRKLLEIIARWLQPAAGCEFSCEANPLDCSESHLTLLRSAGVNRLSLGGQSFSDRKLQRLERDHSGHQLQETLQRCSESFSNLSLDLIFAAPEESAEEWQRDVELALASPIVHLSTYGLTIERGSAFYGRALREQLSELNPDLQLEMYEHAIASLTSAGWTHYEVSNFSKADTACRHNQAYWFGDPWWAFGPGAASFLPASAVDADASDGTSSMIRRVNHQSTTSYIRKIMAGQSPVAESVTLSTEQRVRERLVFGLRQLAGVSMRELDVLYGGGASGLFEPFLEDYVSHGFLERSGEQLRLTRRGLMISDSLWPSLLD